MVGCESGEGEVMLGAKKELTAGPVVLGGREAPYSSSAPAAASMASHWFVPAARPGREHRNMCRNNSSPMNSPILYIAGTLCAPSNRTGNSPLTYSFLHSGPTTKFVPLTLTK